MSKRPLFAAAIGFVLGEVCAWWAESGRTASQHNAASGKNGWIAAAFLTAGLIMAATALYRQCFCTPKASCPEKDNVWRKKSRGMHTLMWMLLFLCVFGAGYTRMNLEKNHWSQLEKQLPEDGDFAVLMGTVKNIREKEQYMAVILHTENTENVLLYVSKEDTRKTAQIQHHLRIGAKAEARGTVSRFEEARNPGQFSLNNYYRTQDISMALFAETFTWDSTVYSPYLDCLYRIRCFCSRILQQICPDTDQGIFRAAILGEKEGMDQDIRDLYQENGISHLLAISGLHLSMIGSGLYWLLRKSRLGFGWAGFLTAAGMFSYGILTGASASAMRAVIMLSLSFLAAYLGRTYDLLSSLSLALVLLAGSHPFLIGQNGFQLSFGAVAGIGLLEKPIEQCLGLSENLTENKTKLPDRLTKSISGWKKNCLKSLAVSLSVQLATCPIVLWHYFQYPLYGILLNLLVVPLMSYAIISGLLGIALGTASLQAGKAAIGSGHYILQWYQWLCRCFSQLPGCQAIWGRPGKLQIFFYYLALFGIVWWFSQNAQNKKRMAASLFCILCLLPRPQNGLDITVLDVGQGDGIILQFEGGKVEFQGLVWAWNRTTSSSISSPVFSRAPENKTHKSSRGTILIDGGSTSDKQLGKNRLEPYLKSEGISWIDFAIVSHGDEDHISGLRYLLEECTEIGIGALVLPEAGAKDNHNERLITAALNRNIPIGYMDAGDWIRAGNCRLTCFYPGIGMPVDFSDRNQQSLVIRADYQNFHMLFTGDVNQEGELMALEYAGEQGLSHIQVLKAAHHGSRFSSGEIFLSALNPDWAVISYEKGNSYGHPHKETLERMDAQGIKLYQTGKQGAVLLHIEPKKATIRTFLHEHQED